MSPDLLPSRQDDGAEGQHSAHDDEYPATSTERVRCGGDDRQCVGGCPAHAGEEGPLQETDFGDEHDRHATDAMDHACVAR